MNKFDIAGHEGYITVGLYDDGRPGELFVTMSKVGSTINGLVDSWATSVSINLQYGVPVDVLFGKFRHQKFEPSGFVRNVDAGDLDKNKPIIRTASSIVDYVSQFMLNNFGPGTGKVDFNFQNVNAISLSNSSLVASSVTLPSSSSGLSASEQQLKLEEQKSLTDFGHEGLVCPHCGGPAKRMGNCATFCTSCKQTTRHGCGE